MAVHGVVERFDRAFTARDLAKGAVELREVFDVDLDMKFAEGPRSEAELAAREAVAGDPPFFGQTTQMAWTASANSTSEVPGWRSHQM